MTETLAFRCRNLTKRFAGFQLGPIDLDLAPGTVLGYIGPNGSGKSTTMNCLAGLLKRDGGEVEIFGRRNDGADPVWKLDLGYVGEVQTFYETWTGAQNLRFLSQFYPDWSDALAADLAGRFEVPLDRKAKHLSRGNRVKLALIGALAHSPRLLLLDEPTGGLDPVVRDQVLDVLFEVVENEDRAIFYSTHILSDISRLADDLAFLVEGRLLLRTAKEDLTEKWRRIFFRLDGGPERFESVVRHRQEGKDHQVVSSDFKATLRQLQSLGAENVQENRMSVEEIAVQILKGGSHVANP